MRGADIQKLTWYMDPAPSTFSDGWGEANFKIFVKEVQDATISAYSGLEGATVVYEGSLDPRGHTEMNIEFAHPYTYGGGNLLIGVYNTVKGYYMSATFVGEMVENACVHGFHSESLDDVAAAARSFLPKTTFTYSDKAAYAASVLPTSLDFGKVFPGREKTLNFKLRNNGLNPFTPTVTVAAPFTTAYEATELAAGGEVEIPVTYAPAEVGEIATNLTVNCGEAGTFTIALNGECSDILELIVCDHYNTCVYAPVYGYNYDCRNARVQMIYPARMLDGIKGADIIGIKYYPEATLNFGGGSVQLSLGTTEDDGFVDGGESVENPVTGLTAVATLTPVMDSNSFEFSIVNPFKYEGGNLAVETLVTEAGEYKNYDTNFLGIQTNINFCWYEYAGSWGSGHACVSFLPRMTIYYKGLQPAPDPITIEGYVTDSEGNALEGVNVTLTVTPAAKAGPATYTATTDATGKFTMEDVIPVDNATYSLTFEKDGYKVVTQDYTPGDEIRVNMQENCVIGIETIEAQGNGKVTYVNVMGQTSERPFQGVNIVLRDGKAIGKIVK